MNQSTDNFRLALLQAGLDYAGPMVADGRLNRFKAVGDKARNSWFILFPGPPMAGAFGCYKRGFKQKWCSKEERNLSLAERDANCRRWQEAERERERTEQKRHAKARDTAAWILGRAAPADPANSYLRRKGIQVLGELRQRGTELILPLRDVAGVLHSLQFVAPDKRFDGERDKTFLRGGRVVDSFFAITEKSDGPLVLCEGYATGASIHEATGFAVVCAMDCGNLKAVAEALRAKWPKVEIIIAADNDAFTKDKDGKPWNPGLEKATAAAKAVHAKLAVPQFADVTTKPTDFNDLHQLRGLDPVRQQIEGAQVPKQTDEEVLQRLAALPPMEFDRRAKGEADALGVGIGTLKSEVAKRRKPAAGGDTLQGRAVNLPDVEPWVDEVNMADALDGVAEAILRYVALSVAAADALALWIAHAHVFFAFLCSPRLNISSPEKGCGKTTLLDVVAALVPRPLLTENLSPAVLFRVVEAQKPTLLADEYDSWLRDNEELRGLLNAGHRRGGQALRCEGDNHEVRGFNVFAPAVLAGIGSLPSTLHDRSIVIRLERAKPGELRERFDSRRTARELELCRKLARWCADNSARLESSDPALPPGAFNRMADNWRPLFAVAEIAGGDWPQRAAIAFAKLAGQEDADAQGTGVALLADVRAAFNETGCGRIWTEILCKHLNGIPERPYAEMRGGQGMNAHRLGKLLGRFKISSRKIRLPDEPKPKQGYDRADFQEAFDRYLPPEGEPKRNIGTSPDNIGDSPASEVEQPETAFHFQNAENLNSGAGCSDVPVPGTGADTEKIYV